MTTGFLMTTASDHWIRSKRATTGCNRHAEQEWVYIKVYWEVSCDSRPSVEMSTAVQKGALLTFYTTTRGVKRKKVKPSTAEESKPIDW